MTVWDFIERIFRKKPNKERQTKYEEYSSEYSDIEKPINVTAIFANSLSKKITTESDLDINGDTARSAVIADAMAVVWGKKKKITAQALGKGGVFLVPYVSGGKMYVDTVEQSLVYIDQMRGEDIVSATFCADRLYINNLLYYRLVDYTLENNQQVIRTRVVNQSGSERPLEDFPMWADIEPEIVIGNVEKSLFGFLRCSVDNRRNKDSYGVPVTYGCGEMIKEFEDHLKLTAREYKLTAPMLGLDSRMWANKELTKTVQDKDRPFVKTYNAGTDKMWEIYAPEIRGTAMYLRYDALASAIEKAVGTSRGILTDPKTEGATATEIKQAQYDTFCLVSDMREQWEIAVRDLCYAIDVLAEYYGLSPAGGRGSYEIKFSWDYSMYESSAETWQQMSELQSRGGIRLARLNQWVTGQTLEEAQAEIDEVTANEPTLEKVLGISNTV